MSATVRWVWLAVVCILGTVHPAWSAGRSTPAPVRFYFVQLTDTHWHAMDSLALTRKAVETINRLPMKIEFVVHTGDLFADSIRDATVVQEGLDAMQGLQVPVYYVPGNHDILKSDPAATARLFEQQFGPLNRRIDVKGVACLLLCTEPLAGETRSPAEVQCEWLAEQAREIGNRPALVFMHRPPVFDMMAPEALGDTSRRLWEDTLAAMPGVQAVIAGHFHRDELHWIGKVPVYVASPLVRFWERQPSIRLYKYDDGKVEFWTIYLTDRTSERVTKPGWDQNATSSRKR